MRLWVVGRLRHKYRTYVFILVLLLIETISSYAHVPFINVLLIPAGVVLVAVVPGFLCVEILFPNKTLKEYERVALSMAISAAIVLTVPFAMSSMGVPFFRSNVVIAIDVVVGALLLGCVIRFRNGLERRQEPVKPRRTLLVIALLCATMFVVVGGLVNHRLHSFQPSFYLTDSAGKFTDYPFQVIENQIYSMELHIDNPTPVDLVGTVTASTGKGKVLWKRSVNVSPIGSWFQKIHLPSNGPSRDETIKFLLSVNNHPNLGRVLWIRYNITTAPS